jgi:hypothetical protein
VLKKSDLAKQFELVVQQEIKNYNDSLNMVLQSLRDLKEEITDAKHEALECNAALHSEMIKLGIELSQVWSAQRECAKKLERHISDQSTINERNTYENMQISEGLHAIGSQVSRLGEQGVRLSGSVGSAITASHKLHQQTEGNLGHLESKLNKAILQAKEDILSRPNELHITKREIEERIAALGHAVMVTEKKIENIYTLIGRLKKAEVIS